MIVNDTNRRRRIVAVLAVICAVLQVGFAPHMALANGHPNFVLVFAGAVALSVGGSYAVAAGFCAGLFFDLVTSGPVGLMAGLLCAVGFVLGSEDRNRLADDTTAALRWFCGAAAVVELAYLCAMALAGQGAGVIETLFGRWLPATLWDCVCFLPFCLVLARMGSGSPQLGKKKGGKQRGYSTKGLH